MDIAGYFEQVTETSEGFKARCPACGDTRKLFSWNTQKQVGCCHQAECRWYVGHGGVTLGRLRAWFNKQGIEHVIPEVIEAAPEADVELPKEFELVKDLDNRDRENIYAYLRHRDLPRQIVDRAKVGYCKSGKYWGYIILPIFDEDGAVAYWQGRRFKDREPKFWNPRSSKKSELIYCVSRSTRPKSMVVVESAINALTLESIDISSIMIIAILGKSMSDSQRDQILVHEKSLRELVIALDGDARRDTVEIAAKFDGIVPVKIANVPDGEDINSLGREKAWSIIRHAELYDKRRRTEFMLREV